MRGHATFSFLVAASMAHGHVHDHHHGPRGLPAGQLDRAMLLGVGLNVAFVVVELAAGFLAGSLALLADAGHNASDVLGLLLAWGADWLSRRPPSRRYTWGLGRSTILAALANAVLLLVACGAILWEAWHRLREPPPIVGSTVIIVAAIGVVINTFTALLFIRGHADANVRGAFLHMAADAAVSAGVVAAGIAIALTGLAWIDPAVSIAIAAVIVVGTWGLFRESLDLALDAVPRGVDVAAVEAALGRVAGVTAVADLHVWGPSTSEVSLTAHLAVAADVDADAVLVEATRLVREEFHMAHSTIQVERQS
jgi:cobalt-zinc-cadmium efflux system protein